MIVNIKTGAPYDVYIGRAGHGKEGYFGNPYRVKEVCSRCRRFHRTAGSTLPCYEEYFAERVAADAEFRYKILALKGKRLGCFCDGECHGRVIIKYLMQGV